MVTQGPEPQHAVVQVFARAPVPGAAKTRLIPALGAEGAARGAALGYGFFASQQESFAGLELLQRIEPEPGLQDAYSEAYASWKQAATF